MFCSDKEESERMPDLSGLTDDDLKAALLRHGVEAGPIVGKHHGLFVQNGDVPLHYLWAYI